MHEFLVAHHMGIETWPTLIFNSKVMYYVNPNLNVNAPYTFVDAPSFFNPN